MVPVTTSVRSGRVSSFLLMQRIGCAVHHQPDPVGVRCARRMLNKLRKIRIRHRRQDRLCGVTPSSHGGNQQADLNHSCIHTTTARGTCCREAVKGGVRLVGLPVNQKSISHQPKHNSRVSTLNKLEWKISLFSIKTSQVLFSGIRLRRDSWVSVMYAEGLNSTTSSATLQRTDRHEIVGQKPSDFQVFL